MTPKERRVAELMARPIDWPCPREAVEMIALEEDCRLKAYLCQAGVPTCGWGETEGVVLGDVWTQEYADQRLRGALLLWTEWLRGLLRGVGTNDNEFSGMLSMSYNVGRGNFATSTVLKCHLRGDHIAAARAFGLFNKVRNPRTKRLEVNEGLTGRRAREAEMYLRQVASEVEPPPQTVQAVEPESKLSRSPMMTAGTVSVAIGGLLGSDGFVQQVAPAATTLSGIAQSMGVTPVTAMGALLAIFGGIVMYYRWKQRSGGWA